MTTNRSRERAGRARPSQHAALVGHSRRRGRRRRRFRPEQRRSLSLLAFPRGGDIWTIRGDGTGARLLLRNGYAPAWSPDGSRLAFVSRRSGDEEIYVARADGSRPQRLTDDGMPDFSPDGKRIVFTSNRDRNGEVYVMSADGSKQRRVTRKAGDDFSPRFSPDGRRIAFTALPNSVFVVNADGAGLRRLTAGTDPDWRP